MTGMSHRWPHDHLKLRVTSDALFLPFTVQLESKAVRI